MHLKRYLLLSAGLAAASLSGNAYAQADARPAASQLDEIVITAQRREENVQKASISIAAVSGQQLVAKGVNDAMSLNGVVPGLKLAYTGTQVQTFIRGVGDVTSNAYTQASVSLNMDGVYVARTSAFAPVFFDTARVEVLRGPQGTLYGRNSSGGAINIISKAPILGDYSGFASIEGGNYKLLRAQAAVNLPLTDTLAIRAAAQSTNRDGYLSDGGNDDVSDAVRLRALWKPTDDLSVLLTGEHIDVGGKGYGRVYRPVLFGDAWTASQDSRITAAAFPTTFVRVNNSLDIEANNFTGELNWNLGPATLTVIPAIRQTKTNAPIGGDFLFASYEDSDQKSLEARLAGDIGPLNLIVGAYGFREDLSVLSITDQRNIATLSGQVQNQRVNTLDTDAWATFAQGTFKVTDVFRLIGGVRYTDESRTRDGRIETSIYTNNIPGPLAIIPLAGKVSVTSTSWRAGAEFDVTPSSMLYASASEGFKSGGFDAADRDIYKPEFVTAYTLGSKNRFLDNRLQFNVEAFYWKFRDQQTSFLGLDSNNLINFLTRNAGQANIYGADLDMIWKPTEADTLEVGVEYLKAKYDSFKYSTVGATPLGTRLTDGCVSGGPGSKPGTFIEDCSGLVLPRSPEWSGNARYSHRFDLGDRGNLVAGATIKFESDTIIGVNWQSPNFRQDAYQLYDLDLTYNAPGDRWTLAGYVRNVGDKAIYLNASNATVPPATGLLRSSVGAIGNPRTYGLRLQMNF